MDHTPSRTLIIEGKAMTEFNHEPKEGTLLGTRMMTRRKNACALTINSRGSKQWGVVLKMGGEKAKLRSRPDEGV